MKKIYCIIISIAFIFSFSACKKELERPDFGLTSSGLPVEYFDNDGYGYADIRNEILIYTNIERQKEGLPPLTGNDPTATAIAFKRAEESAQLFEHQRPDGREYDTVIYEYGLKNWIYIGENLGKGYPTTKKMIEGWMKSPGHRENIMRDFTHMGVGFYVKDDIYYYTQFFVKYQKLDENGNPIGNIFDEQ
jgi:hypothetical protein